MTSANCFSLTRNPFAKLSIPNVIQVLEDEEAEEKTEEKQTVSPPDPTPPAFDKLGLVLNGTMVGNRSRMATINAKNYQERQEIIIVAAESENEGQLGSRSANPTVLIEAIHSGYVVVSYDGQLHELRLQPLTLSQSGRIVVNRLPLEIVDN